VHAGVQAASQAAAPGAAGKRPAAAEIWRKAGEYRVYGVSYGAMRRSWEGAKGLFDLKKADDTLKGLVPHADDRIAMATVLLSGLVVFAIALLMTLESIHVVNFASDTLTEVLGTAQQKLDFGIMLPVTLYYFLLYIVAGTVIFYAHEGVAYALARATGGKGTLTQQIYVSSVLWLALSISLVVWLLIPLPCLVFAAVLSLILVSLLYVMAYMWAKAYSVVHGISLPHAAIIVLLLMVPRLAIWAMVSTRLALLLGIPLSLQGGA
jgi:hypothetical protein